MSKLIVISDPFPRTLELIFTKKKLKELKSKYKVLTVSKNNPKKFYENNIEHRCNGELSLHVLDIIDSIMKASQSRIPQTMRTTCKQPKPFSLEEVKKIMN